MAVNTLSSVGEDPRWEHLGEKAKPATFWSNTSFSIDSWELQGKVIVVRGYGRRGQCTNWGRSYVEHVPYEGAWKAYFPASVCGVRRNIGGDLTVHWPMWLKDIRVYPERAEQKPAASSVPDILEMREGKVETLTVRVKSFGRSNKNGYGSVEEAFCEDEDGNVIKVALWNEDIEKVEGGDTITIKNGYAKEYRGAVSVSAGKFGTLEVRKPDEGCPIRSEEACAQCEFRGFCKDPVRKELKEAA